MHAKFQSLSRRTDAAPPPISAAKSIECTIGASKRATSSATARFVRSAPTVSDERQRGVCVRWGGGSMAQDAERQYESWGIT